MQNATQVHPRRSPDLPPLWLAASALASGIVVAFGRLSRIGPIHLVATWYVEVLLNTPALVQLFLIYF